MVLNTINNKISKSLTIPQNIFMTIRLTYNLASKSINNGDIDFFLLRRKFLQFNTFLPLFFYFRQIVYLDHLYNINSNQNNIVI